MKQLGFLLISSGLSFLLFLQGCSSESLNRQLDTKLEQEPYVKNSDEIKEEANYLIGASKNLSVDQKSRLLDLQNRMQTKSLAIKEECLKLRLLLIKDLAQDTYNEPEVKLIEERLKKLENQKIAMIYSTVDEVNSILGRRSKEKQNILQSFEYQGLSRGE